MFALMRFLGTIAAFCYTPIKAVFHKVTTFNIQTSHRRSLAHYPLIGTLNAFRNAWWVAFGQILDNVSSDTPFWILYGLMGRFGCYVIRWVAFWMLRDPMGRFLDVAWPMGRFGCYVVRLVAFWMLCGPMGRFLDVALPDGSFRMLCDPMGRFLDVTWRDASLF